MSLWNYLPDKAEVAYKKVLHQYERLISWDNIFEMDWDLCIILDACRLDLFEQVAKEYSFITSVDNIFSADSMTRHWMIRTFVPDYSDEFADTVYICANPYGEEWVDHSLFLHYEPVYRTAWDDESGTVLARPVTDATIRVGRTYPKARVLVHYMQPHAPFIHWENMLPLVKENFKLNSEGRVDVWDRLKDGELDLDEVKSAYRENLRYVLDDIALLASNIDREKAIITSDHGNGYGEFGIYGHPLHMPFKMVRKVPLATIYVSDSREYTPQVGNGPESNSQEEQLEALGYHGHQ